ncbi:hypothetical protein EAF00_001818 [Botryotinia globosa]|nr:hypothetical protein EAF00_001818 [Botryotinia globosa]
MLGRETPGQKDRYYVLGCDMGLPADSMQFSTVLHARRTRSRVKGVTTSYEERVEAQQIELQYRGRPGLVSTYPQARTSESGGILEMKQTKT